MSTSLVPTTDHHLLVLALRVYQQPYTNIAAPFLQSVSSEGIADEKPECNHYLSGAMPAPSLPASPEQVQKAHHPRDGPFLGHSSCRRLHRVHSLWNIRAKFIQSPRILYCALRDQQTLYDQRPVIVVEWIVVQGPLGNINQGF
ncbi:hypothetical protein D9619_004590 [Psilocybe cf. subviscida]|uniref:Uncharacterized protein n=1 Tax=Psilocybe cf. subviscida TaxID=2480587 RepID=A0A8H5F8Q7_9AGAR|nr:hypothetical protein D9619_004590 [Psilocybe cf. subviscida]